MLDSTEILETPGEKWRTLTARLPSPREGLRAGTVNNVVFIFGENFLNVMYYSKIELIGIICYQEDMTEHLNIFTTPSTPSTKQRNLGRRWGI